jgi:putative methionine-R-sulfoxide reductase with GAF domain
MSNLVERPDELNRLLTVSEAIESLSAIFAAEEPLDDVLLRVAQTAASAIPGADSVSITVFTDTGARTAAYTDELVLSLDREQYTSGRGPCLEAAEMRQTVRVSTNVEQRRWPDFVAAARQQGILATLSAPLIVAPVHQGDEGELVGSLNIYSRSTAAFDHFDEVLVRLYTVTASQAITNARRWQRSRETVTQLKAALTSRSVIDQAKGAVRTRTGCTADEAFATLVDLSQRRNVKLRDVAQQLLEHYPEP